jgi:hypothetical protein
MSNENEVVQEGIKTLDLPQSIFSWLGPVPLLIIFLSVIIVVTISTGWYLNEDTSPGFVGFWAVVNVFIGFLLFYAWLSLLQNAGAYITYGFKRKHTVSKTYSKYVEAPGLEQ